MEKRKITIVATATNTNKVIMSDATTLRELKRDLDAIGVSHSNMTFYEGLSKVELKKDDTILPHDIPYKGNITNELVIMLTTVNKKIKSGAMSRKEAYNYITKHGLQKKCIETFGRNFTQCSTANLISLVENNTKVINKTENKNESGNVKGSSNNLTINDVMKELDTMLHKGTMKRNVYDYIVKHIKAETPSSNLECPYSDKELDEMLEGLDN